MQKTDVAAYVWPAYTGDEPRTRMFWPEGMGEWQSVKNAIKKAPDHDWPRYPLWGYVNEADPYVMSMEIDAAADHGVNVFIYDWYWFDHRPFLEQCLDNGFLKAPNRDRMKFYLMWANHDANHLWDIRQSDNNGSTVIWGGAVDRRDFETIVHRVIEKYFTQPNYYTIDGCPVFMIYELRNLVIGLGGIAKCREALDYFREETVKAGFKGLNLHATVWSVKMSNASGVDATLSGMSRSDFDQLGFDGMTHYQFVHFVDMKRDYLEILPDVEREWAKIDNTFSQTYYPHISIGWDNNPRFRKYQELITRNNTPENFKKALEMAMRYLDAHPDRQRLITLNSWNEWTETSYLEPDTLHGYGYLDAVKAVVFG